MTMRSKVRIASLLAAVAAIIFLSGCAQIKSFLNMGFMSTGFRNDSYEYSNKISYVWDDGKATFLIPKRGVFLARTVFTPTSEAPLGEDGAYFKVQGVFDQITLSDQAGNPIRIRRR